MSEHINNINTNKSESSNDSNDKKSFRAKNDDFAKKLDEINERINAEFESEDIEFGLQVEEKGLGKSIVDTEKTVKTSSEVSGSVRDEKRRLELGTNLNQIKKEGLD